MVQRPDDTTVNEFLQHSNYIENERSDGALADAWEAWDYAYSHRQQLILGGSNWRVCYMLDIHKLLMYRLNPKIAGKIRNCGVWIGGKRKVFVSIQLIEEELQRIVNMMDTGQYPYIEVGNTWPKQTHIAFEAVHPFEDGNGRTGRILMAIHCLKLGLPIHIIHEGVEQLEYYKWFEGA